MITTETFDFFIKKFEQIPDSDWTTYPSRDNKTGDVWWHCGCTSNHISEEGLKMVECLTFDIKSFFLKVLIVCKINDGEDDYIKLGKTPKERIIKMLQYNREMFISKMKGAA